MRVYPASAVSENLKVANENIGTIVEHAVHKAVEETNAKTNELVEHAVEKAVHLAAGFLGRKQ